MSYLPRNVWEYLRFMHRGLRYRFRVETAEVQFLLRHLSSGQTAIDIGAHKGAFTYWMTRQVGKSGRVVAFEPIKTLADYLRHVKHTVHLPNLIVEQAALADCGGHRMLYMPRDSYLGMTSFTPSSNALGHDEVEVVTYTLDAYLHRHSSPHVDFIKCDVEGHELDVLQGAKETLARCRPILLLECEDFRNGGGQLERVQDFVSEFDYTCMVLDGNGARPYQTCSEELQSSDLRVGIDAWRNFGFVPINRAA